MSNGDYLSGASEVTLFKPAQELTLEALGLAVAHGDSQQLPEAEGIHADRNHRATPGLTQGLDRVVLKTAYADGMLALFPKGSFKVFTLGDIDRSNRLSAKPDERLSLVAQGSPSRSAEPSLSPSTQRAPQPPLPGKMTPLQSVHFNHQGA